MTKTARIKSDGRTKLLGEICWMMYNFPSLLVTITARAQEYHMFRLLKAIPNQLLNLYMSHSNKAPIRNLLNRIL